MVISTIADGVVRSADRLGDLVTGRAFEPVLRIGVTGLARAGKTVFITSLIANLIDRGRMSGLAAAQEGRIVAAYLQPQPDDTVPRFDYESHIAALTGANPHWPESTRTISELRLSLKVRPTGLLAGLQGPRTLHLDIVDYPGEWLLDLGLLEKSFADWSAATLKKLQTRPEATAFLAQLRAEDPDAKLEEPRAQALAAAFTDYLHEARRAGWSDLAPGRFLLPGELAGSPVLTFAPLPPTQAPRGSLSREMERRFEAYKAQVVQPFFRDHFARIDRQVVLVDVLGTLHRGPEAVADMRATLAETLSAFRPGRTAFLTRLLGGRRVEKILFAATKADHLHHSQHARLTHLIEALVKQASERARFAGAETGALAIAALRATTEEERDHGGEVLKMVRGRLLKDDKQAAFYPGDLPEDPSHVLAGEGLGDFQAMAFAPAPMTLRPGDGPPHIRLDRAAQFLIGDRL
ncbi:YcjX family protein [Seohaeicola zhoushanensis]|uniref:YcjX family protein n=1 Tax=Seohaeicola zhoushanensis TaxID=1569283 RepID=UPI00167891B1|nr:YcjX family protein [Seohaeicola zhoushanensis]